MRVGFGDVNDPKVAVLSIRCGRGLAIVGLGSRLIRKGAVAGWVESYGIAEDDAPLVR